jgi:2-amino-4-hydroxy-6-hydroxymethyldihydropteridine diphosphokinase
MTTAYIGLGSNLGDRMASLAEALQGISEIPSTHVENVSRAYESVPAYVEDQPCFLNAVVEVSTGLAADALLQHLFALETAMGRVRDRDKGPRVIDLDLLLFGDEEWNSPELTLPHPGVAERDFVLTPLLEIAPRTVLPDGTHLRLSDASVGEVLDDLGEIPDRAPGDDVGVEPTEWIEVAASETTSDRVAGFDASLQLKAAALEQEGVPHVWDPHEPGADMDPFGLPMVFRLLVPADEAERAREFLGALEEAPIVMPDAEEFAFEDVVDDS